jgi:hypothetical protein
MIRKYANLIKKYAVMANIFRIRAKKLATEDI